MEFAKKRVNGLRKKGEKASAQRMVEECLAEIDRRLCEPQSGKTSEDRRAEIYQGLKPVIETKSVKRGGIAQQIPTPVSDQRGRYRATKWLRDATLKRAKKQGIAVTYARRLELIEVYDELKRRQQGGSGMKRRSEPLQMRDRRHRAAKANRVYVR